MAAIKTTWIKNKGDISNRECDCGTWIEHWKKMTGEDRPKTCPVINCASNDKVVVGAHVESYGEDCTYIVPMCHTCNTEQKEWLRVPDNVKLVLEDACGTARDKDEGA